MNVQGRKLHDRRLALAPHLHLASVRFTAESFGRFLEKAHLDTVDGDYLFAERYVHRGQAMIGGRVDAVEEMHHNPPSLFIRLREIRRLDAQGRLHRDRSRSARRPFDGPNEQTPLIGIGVAP